MRSAGRPRRAGSSLAAVLLAAAALLTGPAAAIGADPTFGPATTSASFGIAITIEQRVTIPAGVRRIEAVILEGFDSRVILSEIANPGAGPRVLRYSLPTPAGGLFPNTVVRLGFRLTYDDGHEVDGPLSEVRYEDDRVAWKTLSGDVVRVHWVEGDDAFGRRALEIGERAIAEASDLLGVTETAPVDFFIYADRDSFYSIIGPGLQENIGGLALANIRTLFANIAPSSVDDPWVGVVVPHELTHLVFDTATRNPYHEPPHWLNEGLADYLAQGYNAGARAAVSGAIRDATLMPLDALVYNFPTLPQRFSLAYDESVSAIDYLIRAFGQDALVALVRSYADGVSDDDAFERALGVDTGGFEAGWLADIGAPAPEPHGPRPAPAGPLPPGWSGLPDQTAGPGGSAGPRASANGGPAAGGDDSSAGVALAILGTLGVIVAGGILVAMRAMARGQAPLAAPEPPDPPFWPAAPPSWRPGAPPPSPDAAADSGPEPREPDDA